MESNLLLAEALDQIDLRPHESELEAALNACDEGEAYRAEKRTRRLSDCGNWSHFYDPHNGRQKSFIFRCELFRECERCLEYRGAREREWMKDASLRNDKVIVRGSQKEIDSLLNRKHEGQEIEKSNYARYPQKDADDILIIEKRCISEEAESDDLRLGWVLSQDWSEILNTPEGRNKSGTVHCPPSDENMDEFTLITTKQFITDAQQSEVVRAMREAEEETAELDPRTPDEVVEALGKRFGVATAKLRKQGYNVQVYAKRLRLVHERINWRNNGDLFNSVNTEKKASSHNLRGPTEPELSKLLAS